jgi:cell division protein FtsL
MRKQQGMTLIGMLFTVVVVVFAAIVVMKIIPIYLQHYSIVQSIKGLNSTSSSEMTGDSYTDISTLRKSLTKRLDINGVEDLKSEQLVISPSGTNTFKVQLKYQAIRTLVYNISILVDFDDTYVVVTGSEN